MQNNDRAQAPKERPSYAIESVDRALRLAVILQVEGPQSVSTVAQRLGVGRSTAHRLLQMLVYRDFAHQTEDRIYRSGPVLDAGPGERPLHSALHAAAMPYLVELMETTGETSNLLVLAGTHVRFVASAEPQQALRVGSREGMAFPAHRTAGGRVLLAALDPDDVLRRYEGEELPANLLTDLDAIRKHDVALNVDGFEKGISAIAVPVRRGDETIAAVTIAMPTLRYRAADMRQLIATALQTAHQIGSAA